MDTRPNMYFESLLRKPWPQTSGSIVKNDFFLTKKGFGQTTSALIFFIFSPQSCLWHCLFKKHMSQFWFSFCNWSKNFEMTNFFLGNLFFFYQKIVLNSIQYFWTAEAIVLFIKVQPLQILTKSPKYNSLLQFVETIDKHSFGNKKCLVIS